MDNVCIVSAQIHKFQLLPVADTGGGGSDHGPMQFLYCLDFPLERKVNLAYWEIY